MKWFNLLNVKSGFYQVRCEDSTCCWQHNGILSMEHGGFVRGLVVIEAVHIWYKHQFPSDRITSGQLHSTDILFVKQQEEATTTTDNGLHAVWSPIGSLINCLDSLNLPLFTADACEHILFQLTFELVAVLSPDSLTKSLKFKSCWVRNDFNNFA